VLQNDRNVYTPRHLARGSRRSGWATDHQEVRLVDDIKGCAPWRSLLKANVCARSQFKGLKKQEQNAKKKAEKAVRGITSEFWRSGHPALTRHLEMLPVHCEVRSGESCSQNTNRAVNKWESFDSSFLSHLLGHTCARSEGRVPAFPHGLHAY
jgi:hypothetical protein